MTPRGTFKVPKGGFIPRTFARLKRIEPYRRQVRTVLAAYHTIPKKEKKQKKAKLWSGGCTTSACPVCLKVVLQVPRSCGSGMLPRTNRGPLSFLSLRRAAQSLSFLSFLDDWTLPSTPNSSYLRCGITTQKENKENDSLKTPPQLISYGRLGLKRTPRFGMFLFFGLCAFYPRIYFLGFALSKPKDTRVPTHVSNSDSLFTRCELYIAKRSPYSSCTQ